MTETREIGVMLPAERSNCAALMRLALEKSESLFDRLVYLASLQDRNTGRYSEGLLTRAFGCDEVDRILREEHKATFERWLQLTLEEQAVDLRYYIESWCHFERAALRKWMRDRSYEGLVPGGAMQAQRRLFVTDLELLLPLLYAQQMAQAVAAS